MDTNTTTDQGKTRPIDRTLYWFATAIPDIIKDSKSDANRSKIVGIGVLFTFLYACIAWVYFWSITVSSPWLYVPLGLFLGFGILTIDRMLIASIKAGKINIVPTIFRVLLALALGTFIAQPVILWMFQEDLKGEIELLNDAKIEERNQQLLVTRESQSQSLIASKESLQDQIDEKYADVAAARKSYQEEIDGTGGSMRYGIKSVGREKGKILEREEQELADLRAVNQPKLDSLDSKLNQIEADYQKEITTYQDEYANTGFLIQVEALQSLIEKDTTGALRNRYILLLIILVLFELVPIISKIFLPTGTYEKHLALIEEQESERFSADHEREKSFDETYNEGAKQQDKRLLAGFFKKSDQVKAQKLDEVTDNWNGGKGTSLRKRVKEIIMD